METLLLRCDLVFFLSSLLHNLLAAGTTFHKFAEMGTGFFWEEDPESICQHSAWTMVVPGDEFYGRRNTVAAFAESAKKGCSACKMLLAVVDEFKPGWIASKNAEKKLEVVLDSSLLEVKLVGSDGSDGDFRLLCRSPAAGKTLDFF